MAGIKRWRGTSDGNLGTAGNWEGGLPVDGDDVVFDKCINAPSSNLAALASVAPNSISVTSSFDLRGGTTTGAIEFGAVVASVDYDGRGDFFNLSVASVPKARIHVDSQNMKFVMWGGEWPDVEATGAGTIEVGAGASVGEDGGDGVWRNIGPKVVLQASSDQVDRLFIVTGEVKASSRNIGTPVVHGPASRLIMVGTTAIVDGGEVSAGGTIIYQASGGLDATVPIEVLPGGIITPVGNQNASAFAASPSGAAFKVNAVEYPGGTIVRQSGQFKFSEADIVKAGQAALARTSLAPAPTLT